mgnify:CR=1 FL=1
MSKLTRLMACVLAIVMATALVFTGCTKKDTKEGIGSATSTQAPAQASTEKKPVTVKWYSFDNPKDAKHKELIAAYQKDNPRVTVSVEYPVENNSVEYLKKVDLLLLSGDKVDIIEQQDAIANSERGRKDQLQALNEFFTKEGKKYDDIYSSKSELDGKIFGLPKSQAFYLVVLNMKHLQEAGLKLPAHDWTFEDYKEYAKKLTKGEGANKRYGSYMHTWAQYHYLPMYNSKLDNTFYKSAQNPVPDFDNPIFKEFFQYKYNMENVDKNQFPLSEVLATKTDYKNIFLTEKASMMPIGTFFISMAADTAKWPRDWKIGFAPIPRWSKNDPAGRTNTTNSYMAMSKNAANKEEAFKFMRYFTTKGQQILLDGVSAEKGADNSKLFEALTGPDRDKLFDIESLKTVFGKLIPNPTTYQPVSGKPIYDLFVAQAEKYLVGGQSLDVTMKNLIEQGNEIHKKEVAAAAK